MYLCQTQEKVWSRIKEDLEAKYMQELVNNLAAERPKSPVNRVLPENPVPPVDDPARVRFRLRVAHLIRGMIFVFALGLPRVFYYVYAGYGLLVLSGLLDELQSVHVRHFITGSRPSLDLQLVRLRQRREFIQKLSETLDEEEVLKMRDFLETFKPEKPFHLRFMYQLFLMFFYSALPSCYPHKEFLT